MTEAEGLYPTLVANSVFNAFLSYTATVLNIITIQALRKASSLATGAPNEDIAQNHLT